MIYILWATIRPEIFLEMHKVWMQRALNKNNIITKVAVNWEQHKTLLKDFDVVVVNTDKIGVCYPSYVLSSNLECENDSDIVIFASDDFKPPINWDQYLIEKLKHKSGALMVLDGYQLPDSSNMLFPCITIPIMTYDCLLKLNKIIYNPVYNHMYSDCELYLNLKDLGLLIDERLTDTTTFEHLHYAAGKRNPDNVDQQYHLKWKDDEIMWNKRKIMTLEERLA
jgi:hypothetical protein